MTIARRLIVLLAAPLLILLVLGFLVKFRLDKIEQKSRFVAKTQIGSLAALGDISRRLADMRVKIRSYLLDADNTKQADAEALLRQNQKELDRLLNLYNETLISDDRDRKLTNEFQQLSRESFGEAEKLIVYVKSGRRQHAINLLLEGFFPKLGDRFNTLLGEWIEHNQSLAVAAGQATTGEEETASRNLLLAVGLGNCSSSCCACSVDWTRSSRVFVFCDSTSILMATIGSNFSRSAFSCVVRARKDATSIAPRRWS